MQRRDLLGFGFLAALARAGAQALTPGSTTPANTSYLSPGASFTLNRAALIDSLGRVGSVAGSPTNCVLVDGTSEPCGGSIGAGGGGGIGGAGQLIQASFSNNGSALTAPTTTYVVCPYAGTITGWSIAIAPSGTATFMVWKSAAGTGIPTSSNSISTDGESIASGTEISSTNISDFTTLVVNAGDIFGIHLSALSGSPTQAEFTLNIFAPGTPPSFSGNETPAQVSTLVYTLAFAPSPAAMLQLFLNGTLMAQNVDYTVSGQTLTFITYYSTLLATTQTMLAFYQYAAI